MFNSISSISSVSNRTYFLNEAEVDKSNHNSAPSEEVIEEIKEPVRRNDPYSKMPIRLLGYTNELGEAVRPISPLLANLSWLPAIGYISADIADKYKQDEYSNQKTSKGRASKQLVTQLLGSVFLPTIAVKIGQSIVNAGGAFTKKGLTINTREKISDIIVDSMKSGEHKNFLDETGKVNKETYKESLYTKIDEILKHRKTHNKNSNPVKKVFEFLTKPLIKQPSSEKIKKYASTIADRMIDDRQQILDGLKPKNLSQKRFNKIMQLSKDVSAEEKQSIAFNTVRKMEKGRMFNNRVLKSIGGLVALSIMAKPIDKFVEHVIIKQFVSPQIDNISELYYKQIEARKKSNKKVSA